MNSNIPDVTDEEQLIFFEVCINNLLPRCFDSGSNAGFVMHVSGRVQATNFEILRIIKKHSSLMFFHAHGGLSIVFSLILVYRISLVAV